MSARRPWPTALAGLALAMLAAPVVAATLEPAPLPVLARIAAAVCKPAPPARLDFEAVLTLFPGARPLEHTVKPFGGFFERRVRRLDTGEGHQLSFLAVERYGILMRLSVEIAATGEQPPRPLAALFVGPDCAVTQGRVIRYRGDNVASALDILDAGLATVAASEPLNPAAPAGVDAQGVSVAVIDSGIAYTRPDIAARLARGPDGAMIGRDFWDMDGFPFDADTSASPFLVRRHGTLLADILLAEGPAMRLIPVRYPRPRMARFKQLVEFIAAAGAGIATLAMGSDNSGDWQAFRDAAAAEPELLFVVSAGNNGRDIDQTPVYPASFDLGNLLVVTSVTAVGAWARGSNWGAVAVDVAVPAETLTARDYQNRLRPVAGSSFAVPRIAALAARLKAKHPDWRAARLKAVILALARPLPGAGPPRTAAGWIAAPDKADAQ